MNKGGRRVAVFRDGAKNQEFYNKLNSLFGLAFPLHKPVAKWRPEKACESVPILAPSSWMIDRTKKLPARFYVSPAGRKPVREWILELPEADRHTVGKDIQKVEFGWPLGRPHCAPLGAGLWEVRSALDGARIARVIFCMGDGHMILLHGFIKKTRKTPQADIDLALKRKKEVT
jgi:phage-related protein